MKGDLKRMKVTLMYDSCLYKLTTKVCQKETLFWKWFWIEQWFFAELLHKPRSNAYRKVSKATKTTKTKQKKIIKLENDSPRFIVTINTER